MKKTKKRVGRFQLSAKGGKDTAEAFKRVDGKLINVRPSSSGAGRKLTRKQRIRAGLEKEAAVDPRWMRYGLPALAGAALGGLSGGRGATLGAALGAGAGHYALTPENQAKIRQQITSLLGGTVEPGAGSSAEPSTVPTQPMFKVPKAWINSQVSALARSLVGQGMDVSSAYKMAVDHVSKGAHDLRITGADGPHAAGAMLKDTLGKLSDQDQINLLAGQIDTNPFWGTKAGTSLWMIDALRKGLGPGMQDVGLYGFALPKLMGGKTPIGTVGAIKSLADLKGVVSGLPGAAALWSAVGDIGSVIGTGLQANIDPNLSVFEGGWHSPSRWRLGNIPANVAKRLQLGGSAFGRKILNDMYGGGDMSSFGKTTSGTLAGLARVPIAAAVAHGDAQRAWDAAEKSLTARGYLDKDHRTGAWADNSRNANLLRRRLQKGRLGSDPMTMLSNPLGAAGQVLGNAGKWWGLWK